MRESEEILKNSGPNWKSEGPGFKSQLGPEFFRISSLSLIASH